VEPSVGDQRHPVSQPHVGNVAGVRDHLLHYGAAAPVGVGQHVTAPSKAVVEVSPAVLVVLICRFSSPVKNHSLRYGEVFSSVLLSLMKRGHLRSLTLD
jgi:hypothetical protein